MADAMEAVRQAVDEEAPDELVRIERHQPGCVAVTVIAPAEGYAGLVRADQATVGDGDPVGVAAKVGEDMFGRTERRLRIDDPALASQQPDRGCEGTGVSQPVERAGEAQPSGRMGHLKPIEEQPPEQARENMDRQEEGRSAAEPSSIRGERAARNEAMNVRMMREHLTPCVKNGQEADLAAQMPGVGRDGLERRGDGVEQDRINDSLVVEGDLGDLGRHREHDMEIRHRQQVCLTVGKPSFARRALALGAVPIATAVECDAGMRAVLAGLDMTAKRCGSAKLDRGHYAAFDAAKMAVMGSAISMTMAAENIRHLQSRAHHSRLVRRYHLQRQTVERALRPGDRARGHMRVARGRRQVVVPQQDLDDPDIRAALEQMGREAVAQRMHADPLDQTCRLGRRPAGRVEHLNVDRFVAPAWDCQ